MTTPLLSVRDLRVAFRTPNGSFEAVRGVSFEIAAGETVAVVGESGSGKSTIASSINRLLADNGRIAGGSIRFEGTELSTAPERTMRGLRGAGIGLVPQDPMSNLNPVHTVGAQISEALQVHGRGGADGGRARTLELLEMVGIPEPAQRYDQYPHEFSGGMRQRALIAMGLACEPRLLIADEPTSALDVTVQRRILDTLGDLTARSGTAVLLITHDLALAAERADRVLVMLRGELVEAGPAREILERPQHEYTQRLVSAAPSLSTTTLVAPAGTAERPEPIAVMAGVGRSYRMRGAARGTDFWAARDVSFSVPRGQTVAIVGESGSGKSTTAKMLLGLEDPSEGSISIEGQELAGLSRRALLAMRRRVQPVFQNPFASLDPRYTVAASIVEPLRVHRVGDRRSRTERVHELLHQVALPADAAERLPHELSGGQRQRVAIARALALEPQLVVLDEAVSALDVLVQAQILDLLVRLQQELGLSYLFISHDLAVVNMIAHEVHVMQRGRIVESGTPQQLFSAPAEPYTRELIAAIPGATLATDR
ncbi:ABC transporter ATP-binding protein [Agrococcus sp. 1P02AA]|uniref:ABC transporter ATP-binding protein n=1 Tax=Agrococcus sp. 1P02AA TaxID=3132259 RepID=UPI0039A66B08